MRRGVDLDLVGSRDHHLLGHVADALVHHDHDRDAELLGKVEGRDGQVEAFLRGIRAERDDLVVAVRSPPRLHHVGLRGQRGQPGGRSAALHVDEHAGRFGHGGVADVLHHQREAGAGGDREGLRAAPDRALHGDGGGQFVFHLDEDSADRGNAPRKAFDDFGRRSDGISCGKSRTGCQCSFTTGVVAVEEMCSRQDSFADQRASSPPMPFFLDLRSDSRRSRNRDNTSRTSRSRCIFPVRPRGVGGSPWR